MFRWYRWLVWFWWAKVRGKPETVCRPDCPLCEVQMRSNDHYSACPTCQGDGFPCEAMRVLQGEEEVATLKLFPELAGPPGITASSVPVQVFPPWDLSKP